MDFCQKKQLSHNEGMSTGTSTQNKNLMPGSLDARGEQHPARHHCTCAGFEAAAGHVVVRPCPQIHVSLLFYCFYKPPIPVFQRFSPCCSSSSLAFVDNRVWIMHVCWGVIHVRAHMQWRPSTPRPNGSGEILGLSLQQQQHHHRRNELHHLLSQSMSRMMDHQLEPSRGKHQPQGYGQRSDRTAGWARAHVRRHGRGQPSHHLPPKQPR